MRKLLKFREWCNKFHEDGIPIANAKNEVLNKLKELFKKDTQGVFDWWKPKAIERYKKLHSEGNIKSDILFYNKMIGMTYDEAKSKFFDEVGR